MNRRVVLKARVRPGHHEVSGRRNLKFLSVAMQEGQPTVWFEVDADSPLLVSDPTVQPETCRICHVIAVLTGEDFTKPDGFVFLGSAVSDHFVVHVYVEKQDVGDHHY